MSFKGQAPRPEKPTRTSKALASSVIGLVLAIGVTYLFGLRHHDAIDGGFPEARRPIISWIGYFCLAYITLTFYLRYKSTGGYVLHELLWGCNYALYTFALGCLIDMPVLCGAALATVTVDQLMWYVDCSAYLLTGKFPVGVARYMVWPELSLTRKLTSFHHLWFLPLGLYALRGYTVLLLSFRVCVFVCNRACSVWVCRPAVSGWRASPAPFSSCTPGEQSSYCPLSRLCFVTAVV
ncbi:MAG: hypothetical protein MHM6MM_004492 [Cercozoa sp. M6MM]